VPTAKLGPGLRREDKKGVECMVCTIGATPRIRFRQLPYPTPYRFARACVSELLQRHYGNRVMVIPGLRLRGEV
jgi:hypothetical protein